MELITYLHAVILGIVEGLTEFLPVSSTGHLIVLERALGFSLPSKNSFIIAIQLGSILAVCWLYRQKIFDVIFHLHQPRQQQFALRLFIGFLPAAVIGFLFHDLITTVLFSPLVVAVMLIVGGIIIWLVEKYKPEAVIHDMDDMTMKQAFLVGCAQAVAVIPGTSRSGATIMGGLLLRLDRKVAAEFSFFLAMPVMVAATVFDLYKHYDSLTMDALAVMGVGFITSFFAGLVAVKLFVSYVSRHSFIPFAVYRIVFGTLMLFVFWP